MFPATAKRVMSLQQPHLKMSKSHTDARSRILLNDTPDQINSKVMAALTDSTNNVSYDPTNRPGVTNLLRLLSYFDPEGRSAAELGMTHSALNLRNFKLLVADSVSAALEDIRTRYDSIVAEDDGRYIDHVERLGAARAQESAESTMVLVREAVGL